MRKKTSCNIVIMACNYFVFKHVCSTNERKLIILPLAKDNT